MLNINVKSTELSKMLNTKAIFYTSLALIAFAGNSILCRLALADGKIDPASFTNIRLSSGIIALLLLSYFSSKVHCHTVNKPLKIQLSKIYFLGHQ